MRNSQRAFQCFLLLFKVSSCYGLEFNFPCFSFHLSYLIHLHFLLFLIALIIFPLFSFSQSYCYLCSSSFFKFCLLSTQLLFHFSTLPTSILSHPSFLSFLSFLVPPSLIFVYLYFFTGFLCSYASFLYLSIPLYLTALSYILSLLSVNYHQWQYQLPSCFILCNVIL